MRGCLDPTPVLSSRRPDKAAEAMREPRTPVGFRTKARELDKLTAAD